MREVISSSLPKPVRDSLRNSLKEGVVAEAVIKVFDYYLIPFALFIGAANRHIGLLVSIPSLLSSLSRLIVVKSVEIFGGRHRLIVTAVLVQTFCLALITLLAVSRIPGRIFIYIGVVSLFTVFGGLMGPPWGSMVSDYLPADQRGRFFGWRSRFTSIAGIVSVIFWGGLLQITEKISPLVGFMILFGIATLLRLLSFVYMKRMVEVPIYHPEAKKPFSFFKFIRIFKKSNFLKFLFYIISFTAATQLASPFFNVFMLRQLDFSYISYSSVHLAFTVTGLIAFPIWGRHADAVGNVPVIKNTGLLLPLIPLLWILARHPLEFMAVEALSGFLSSGFNLCTTNFIYESVSPHQRMPVLAYYNLLNGAGVFIGATLGGFLSSRLPPLLGESLYGLFILSAGMRFLANAFLSRRFGEIREKVPRVSSTRLYMSVLGFRPLSGENVEYEAFPLSRFFRRGGRKKKKG